MGERTDFPRELRIRKAEAADCPLILAFIRELAEYEKLSHEVRATPERLRDSLFGEQAAAEVLIAEWEGQPAGFALFFTNYSTFLAKPGIYLEDLFVRQQFRGHGIGLALLSRLAKLVADRDGGRLDWWVLHWNERAINFYERLGARKMSDWVPMRLEGESIRTLADAQTSATR